MLFTKLKLNYFGRFHNKEIQLKQGINIIYGDNEAGKSTIHAFIKGMLFGIEKMRGRACSSRQDMYNRYLPWDYPGAYSGSMDISIGGKEYRLQRSFHANDKFFDVIDMATGRKLQLSEGNISELIHGLTESIFRNTISIEQLKAHTDSELAAELRNYITNLSISKSKEIDVNKALSLLNEKRKKLEDIKLQSELQRLQEEIDEGLIKEKRMEELSLQLKDLSEHEKMLKKRLEALALSIDNEEAERIEQLPVILEKYKSYQDVSEQLKQIRQKQKRAQEQIELIEKSIPANDILEEDANRFEQIKAREQELLMQLKEYKRQNREFKGAKVKAVFYTIFPFFAAAIAVRLLASAIPKAVVIYGSLLALGLLSYIMLIVHKRIKQKEIVNAIKELNTGLKQQQAQLNSLLMKYQLSSAEAFYQKQKEMIKSLYELESLKEQVKSLYIMEDELEDNKDALYEAIMRYMQYFIHEDELTDFSINRLKEVIQQKKLSSSKAMSELTAQYNDCRLRIEKLKWEMSELEGNEHELIKKQELYKKLLQEQNKAAVEWKAVKLAIDTIVELSAHIHDSFGQELNKRVSEIICEITKGKYNELRIDEKLDVKVGWNDVFLPLEKLSAGTIDQVYLSLRLAVADLLLGKEEMPLLLDDSFAFYDDSRLKAAISKISGREQVILLTCHKRELKVLEELGLPYNLIVLSEG